MKFRQKNYIHDFIINLASHCHSVSILKVSLVSVICLSGVLCEIHLLFDRFSLFLLAHNDWCLSIGNFFFTVIFYLKYMILFCSVSLHFWWWLHWRNLRAQGALLFSPFTKAAQKYLASLTGFVCFQMEIPCFLEKRWPACR